MTALLISLMTLGTLVPDKTWYAPDQPMNLTVRAAGNVTLVLRDFAGRSIDPAKPAEFSGTSEVDLRAVFPTLTTPGAYVLYEIDKGSTPDKFISNPQVITVRKDPRRGAPEAVMVTKIEPLKFVVVTTDAGEFAIAFYYDVAPNTVANFINLAQEGFYDDLAFHRVFPGFVLKAGDPRGDDTGGPGYSIDAEFSSRTHQDGVVSMSRARDPNEAPGVGPRPEFANSAGSQFFICLNYANTKQLDGRYTVFGRVVSGWETIQKIEKTPLANQKEGKPTTPVVIKKIEVRKVSAEQNPYPVLMGK